MTSGVFGSVRSPIGVSTFTGVTRVVQPAAVPWHVSALSTTVIRLRWARTRSGAGSVGLQPGAPAARLEFSADQQAKVSARERTPSELFATAVSTVWFAVGPLTPEIRATLPSLSLLT